MNLFVSVSRLVTVEILHQTQSELHGLQSALSVADTPLWIKLLRNARERCRYIMLSLWMTYLVSGQALRIPSSNSLICLKTNKQTNKIVESSFRMWSERIGFISLINFCKKTTCLVRIHCKLISRTCKNFLTNSSIFRKNAQYNRTRFYHFSSCCAAH